MTTLDEEWVTVEEASELTGYSVVNIRRQLKTGNIIGKKWSRDWMVDKGSLLAYKEAMDLLGNAKHDPWRTGARKKRSPGS